ncbi:hypothetical protein GOODEAATRI_007779 [Goodea atripinnis]|uniref:BH3-interacting domain death agonist n=1 Tax=Goodea atripinnis TaxID=208336 RepID=A0ABV0MZJ5_9TELE
MDGLGFLANEEDAALVVFAFLQTDCLDLNYSKELFSKGKDLIATRDINHNGQRIDTEDIGDLETDGHLPGNITVCLEDILPLVELQRPGDHEEAINIQAVAQGLREIASQLELEAVSRATQNLSRNISESPSRVSFAPHLNKIN